ncbi:sigma 54-interacting transcriptional regulator [bacterium]|nr:sigma 54-interacting transcriptional regulator [bacterium]
MTSDQHNNYESLLDSIADGVFSVDLDFRITSFNRAAEKILGIKRTEALGQYCWNVFRATICEKECSLRETLDTNKPIIDKSIQIITAHGQKKPISISTAILRDPQGNIIGGVETFRDLSQVEALKKELFGSYSYADMISRTPKMIDIFRILPEIARVDSTVLITGESGTGKELMAKAIHDLSPRRQQPFIAVNCGAIPETLIESELFGYKKGAFTDARTDKPGRFTLARNGTIFLDEIADLPLATQVKILRVLDERSFEPLGAVRSERSQARTITATNKDIKQLVEQGSFREDLYYRINIIRLDLPPLRERKEDIPLLIDHFIHHFNTLHNKNIKGISDPALALLMNHSFPGNIRELKNIIERSLILMKQGLIEPHNLPDELQPQQTADYISPGLSLAEVEKRHILNTLRTYQGNRNETALALGIHRSTLYRKLQEFGLADIEPEE